MDELLEFKKNAILGKISGQPLCKEYKAALRKCGNNKELLVRLALMQQCAPYLSHACYEKIGLSKEYILANFDEYINGKRTFENVEGVVGYTYQLYVGYNGDLSVSDDVLSFMWCDIPSLEIKTSKCPIFYINNKSKCGIVSGGCNSIRVYLFDESEVTLNDIDETSDVVVYKYSDNCKVVLGKYCMGKVKQFRKKLVL